MMQYLTSEKKKNRNNFDCLMFHCGIIVKFIVFIVRVSFVRGAGQVENFYIWKQISNSPLNQYQPPYTLNAQSGKKKLTLHQMIHIFIKKEYISAWDLVIGPNPIQIFILTGKPQNQNQCILKNQLPRGKEKTF